MNTEFSHNNSGARYHRVTTYSVNIRDSLSTPRANPKSQMAKSQLLLTRILEGFKSRCNTYIEKKEVKEYMSGMEKLHCL